jgi:hypothetical protein
MEVFNKIRWRLPEYFCLKKKEGVKYNFLVTFHDKPRRRFCPLLAATPPFGQKTTVFSPFSQTPDAQRFTPFPPKTACFLSL